MRTISPQDPDLSQQADAIDKMKYVCGSSIIGGISGSIVGSLVCRIRGEDDEVGKNIATILTIGFAAVGGILGGRSANQVSIFAEKHPILDRTFDMSVVNQIADERDVRLQETENKTLESAPEEEYLMQTMP